MKKLLTIVSSLLFVTMVSAKADFGVGITGAAHMFDIDGTETTRDSGQVNTGSHSDTAIVPELFLEVFMDNGAALGVSYIPTRDMGSKSRSDTSTAGDSEDTGTYTAKAKLDNVVQIYTDIPMTEFMGYSLYGKLGIQHATIKTQEALNSGSAYPDKDVLGYTLGIGTKGDLPYGNNLYYKVDATYTNFEDYKADSDSSPANKVEAELEDTAVKFSVGYKF
jgi:hypothetical protein